MRSKLWFLGIFLATLAVAAAHAGEFPRFLLGFELLLCVFLFLSVRGMRRQVLARLRLPESFGEKEGNLRVEVQLENTGRIPMPDIRVELGYRDMYEEKCGRLSAAAMLDEKGKAVLRFHMASAHCGVFAFWIEQVTVSDHLGLFRGKCERPEGILELSVLPPLHQKQGEYAGWTQPLSGTEGMYSLERPGDDMSEMYDVREFRQGDTLHRIHWKMTAKTGEILVRNFSRTAENTILVLYDLRKQGRNISRSEWDDFLEMAAAFSEGLLCAGNAHDAVWLDGETGETVRMHVGSGEELQTMLSVLLRASVYENKSVEVCDTEEMHSEIIRVSLGGKITRESLCQNIG